MGLERFPKTIALTPLNLSPIGLTSPPFVKVFGWDLGTREFFKQPDVSHVRVGLAGSRVRTLGSVL